MEEEKIYQELQIDFLRKFKTNFYPKLNEFINKKLTQNNHLGSEKSYALFNKKGRIIFGLLFTITMFIVYKVSVFFANIPETDALLVFFAGPVTIMWIYALVLLKDPFLTPDSKNYSKNVKKKILPEFCKCFPSLVWTQNKIKKSVDYRNIGLPIVGISDDSFLGNYKKIMFVIDEFIFGEDNTYGYSYFLLIKLNMNKFFKSHTVICPKGKMPAVNGLYYTQMEDVVFERKYDVYTNDDVEARYLITPTFIQKLNNLENKYKSIYTYISFYKEKFYIYFKVKKDLFELNNNKDVFDENIYFEWFEEILAIYKLIDYFKLEQKIGL